MLPVLLHFNNNKLLSRVSKISPTDYSTFTHFCFPCSSLLQVK